MLSSFIEDLLVLHGRLLLRLIVEYLKKTSIGQDPSTETSENLASYYGATAPVGPPSTGETVSSIRSGCVISETEDRTARRKQKMDKKIFVRNVNYRVSSLFSLYYLDL